MINYVNYFFIVFNLFLLLLIYKKNNSEHFQPTESAPPATSTPHTPSKTEDEIFCDKKTTTCTYNETTDETNNRSDCFKNCTAKSNCNEDQCVYKCLDKKCSKWTTTRCEFTAFGNSVNSCTKECLNQPGCNYDKCYETCNSCKNEVDCPWYKKIVNEKEEFIKQNAPTNIDPLVPLPPTIFVTVKNDNVATVNFNPPFSIYSTTSTSALPVSTPDPSASPAPSEINYSTLDNEINSFMYIVYKTQDKNSGIRIGTHYLLEEAINARTKYNTSDQTNLSLPIIEFDIDNLEKDTFYNIAIRSYRDSDETISPISNIFTILPNKERKHEVPKLVTSKTNVHVDVAPKICKT